MMTKIDKNDIIFKTDTSSGNIAAIIKNPNMRRPEDDKFKMYILNQNNQVIKDWGTHPSLDGAKHFLQSRITTEKFSKMTNKKLIENKVRRIVKEVLNEGINPNERILDGFTYRELLDEVENAKLQINEKNVRHMFDKILSQLIAEAKQDLNKNINNILKLR